MIGLLEKAGVSLDKSFDNINYQLNIIYQLQENINYHPDKYSIKDAKVYNKMIKQLKEDPIFTRRDNPKYIDLSDDYHDAIRRFNNLELHLS